jgi:hypothetical protein
LTPQDAGSQRERLALYDGLTQQAERAEHLSSQLGADGYYAWMLSVKVTVTNGHMNAGGELAANCGHLPDAARPLVEALQADILAAVNRYAQRCRTTADAL